MPTIEQAELARVRAVLAAFVDYVTCGAAIDIDAPPRQLIRQIDTVLDEQIEFMLKDSPGIKQILEAGYSACPFCRTPVNNEGKAPCKQH